MSGATKDPGAPANGAALSAQPRAGAQELVRRYGPVAAGYALPFALVFYLAMRGGGYDSIVRGEVGIAVWWIVLVGAIVGVLPVSRLSNAAWVGLGLLAAFTVWTGVAISWSESSERSVIELARVTTYVGVFALALAAQGRNGLRRAVYSVGAAIALVGVLALLSRLHPQWFPENEAAAFLDAARSRLNYPLHYWNGLAALIAVGVPLLLWIATEARRVAIRALAAAVIPAISLAAYYTLSRGGAAELAIALVVLVALHPRRLSLVPTLALTAVGSALLIAAASQRDQLADGLTGQAAVNQGDEMVAVVLVVSIGVALVQAALGLAAKYEVGPRPQISRRNAWIATVVIGLIVVVGAVAAGLPGELSDRWQEFKRPQTETGVGDSADRFASSNGNGRYQLWQAATDANGTRPLTGIGPGTYEFWWAEHGSVPGFVRDAHSLYLESLAEVGWIGLVMIAGLIGTVLGVGVVRSVRDTQPERRALLAAATAGCTAFAVAAAVDWAWELAVLPVAFLMLGAGLLSHVSPTEPSDDERPVHSGLAPRIGLAGLAAVAMIAIAIPLAGDTSIRASQESAGAGNLPQALGDARSAKDVQPYAATPSLQQAFVLELTGEFDHAVVAARQATREESTNWRTWLALSRLEARAGNAKASVDAFRTARDLNPRSPLFQ